MMYKIIKLQMNSGERLSCLINEKSGLPVKVANRWALNYRRYRTQSSTLEQNLRDLSFVYNWSSIFLDLDLDRFILSGKVISSRQINGLAEYLRKLRVKNDSEFCSHSSFNNKIRISKNFFIWSLDAGNRGGLSYLSKEEYYKTEHDLARSFDQHIVEGNHTISHKPLTECKAPKIVPI